MKSIAPLTQDEVMHILDSQEKFWVKTMKCESGCIEWIAARDTGGYGVFSVCGKMKKAHRVAFVLAHREDVPTGLILDHICRNKACVNQEHLQAVTQRINVLRGDAPPSKQVRRTVCPQGHALSTGNAIPSVSAKGWRKCATCHRERADVIRRAYTALAITRNQYVKKFGWSVTTALNVLNDFDRADSQ